jgi:hypothetical protein
MSEYCESCQRAVLSEEERASGIDECYYCRLESQMKD